MDDYIRREAAKAQIRMAYSRIEDRVAINCVLNDVPAADVAEVRHGWWMDSKEDGHPSICCVCNYPVDRFFKTKFCPHCGARMDGGADK